MDFLFNTLTSVIELIVFFCFFITSFFDRWPGAKRDYTMPFFMFCCVLRTVFSILLNHTVDFAIPIRFILATLYPMAGYFIFFSYMLYFIETCDASQRVKNGISVFNLSVLLINLLVTIALLPTGKVFYYTSDNDYMRGEYFFVTYIFVVIGMLINIALSVIIKPHKRTQIGFLSYSILPIVAMIVSGVDTRGYNYLDLAIMFSVVILFTVVYMDEKRKAYEKEIMLTNYRTEIMMSQIGPHFIYNALTTIAALCVIDAQKARELTVDFSQYLRKNLNLSKMNKLSEFSEELEHTKIYLKIEKVRFGDTLNIEYDIADNVFYMPSLSLQPIVENAVKHGVTKKQGGGTVKISSYYDNKYNYVIVSDDGVGFDVKNAFNDGEHYGIITARDRIESLLGGTLTIESTVGVGTTVTVKIPREA